MVHKLLSAHGTDAHVNTECSATHKAQRMSKFCTAPEHTLLLSRVMEAMPSTDITTASGQPPAQTQTQTQIQPQTQPKAAHDQHFDGVWSATDSAHFRPTLPLKHIPRAWERKAQSPLVKQRSSRKIWRRHDFPQSQPATIGSASGSKQLHNARLSQLRKGLTASYSPKKIVKKRCLHTSFGQTAKPNHWDLKASTPLRMSLYRHGLQEIGPPYAILADMSCNRQKGHCTRH